MRNKQNLLPASHSCLRDTDAARPGPGAALTCAGRRAAGRGAAPRAMAAAEPPGAGDLPQLAESLLCQLQENFQALTEKITLRMEEMGERIDDLEKHVADLMTEAGIENTDEESRVKKLYFSSLK
ncbi:heat shock factor-binding protein 1-like protein 1 [Anser cygnoides]|uniref:heat shock factor-binding protein 1-like protein 1 n=2 Tax=Anatidae TaxID=8830 RepID=UPI0034D218AE